MSRVVLKVTEEVTLDVLENLFFRHRMESMVKMLPLKCSTDIERWQYQSVSISFRPGEIELEADDWPPGARTALVWLQKKLSNLFTSLGWLEDEEASYD